MPPTRLKLPPVYLKTLGDEPAYRSRRKTIAVNRPCSVNTLPRLERLLENGSQHPARTLLVCVTGNHLTSKKVTDEISYCHTQFEMTPFQAVQYYYSCSRLDSASCAFLYNGRAILFAVFILLICLSLHTVRKLVECCRSIREAFPSN